MTQGIQDLGNAMPLIPSRPTFARVYIAVDDGTLAGTRGILAGYRNGSLVGTVTPLNQPLTAVEGGLPRVELASSLLFRIPGGWTSGGLLTLTAFVYAGHVDTVFEHEPDSDDNFRSTSVTFLDSGIVVQTMLAPIHLHDGFTEVGTDITWWPEDHPDDLAMIVNGLERLLPVSFVLPHQLGFDIEPGGHADPFAEWDIDEDTNLEDGQAFEALAMLQAWREASDQPLSSYMWYGLLPDIAGLSFWNADIGEAVGYSGLSNGTVSMGEMTTTTQADVPFELSGSKTMAHEFGHDLGLGHYGCIESEDPPGTTKEEKGGGLDPDFPTPYPNCRFAFVGPQGFYGLDVHYDRFPGLTEPSVIGNDLTFDPGKRAWPLMSYGPDKWVDPYSYCRMLEALAVTCNAYPPPEVGVPGPDGIQGSLGRPVQLISAQRPASTVFVSGFASNAGTRGRLFELGVREEVPPETLRRSERRLAEMAEASPPSPVAIVFYDQGGRELGRHPLARVGPPPDEGPGDAFSFVEWIPAPAGLTRVVLEGGGKVLGERKLSASVPQVEVVAPTAGSALAGAFTLEWQGRDADGDALRYDVLVSPDGGETWTVVARQITATKHELEADQLPASGRTRFRILAYDGFATAHAETGDLSVSNSGPKLVLITGPAGGSTYALNDLVVLSGRASDLEDKMVEKLAWTSDRDGELGIGPEVATRDLSAGEHVITLKATDSQGLTGEATVRVVIDGSRVADAPDAATQARLRTVLSDHHSSSETDGLSWAPVAAVVGVSLLLGAAGVARHRRGRTRPS